jgi:hypothetical protein
MFRQGALVTLLVSVCDYPALFIKQQMFENILVCTMLLQHASYCFKVLHSALKFPNGDLLCIKDLFKSTKGEYLLNQETINCTKHQPGAALVF